jgi:hypothetical protein
MNFWCLHSQIKYVCEYLRFYIVTVQYFDNFGSALVISGRISLEHSWKYFLMNIRNILQNYQRQAGISIWIFYFNQIGPKITKWERKIHEMVQGPCAHVVLPWQNLCWFHRFLNSYWVYIETPNTALQTVQLLIQANNQTGYKTCPENGPRQTNFDVCDLEKFVKSKTRVKCYVS